MRPYKEIDPRTAGLVRVDESLRRNKDSRIEFSMSDELIQKITIQRDLLAQELGLSNDRNKRIRQIAGIKSWVFSKGYPYWNDSMVSLPEINTPHTIPQLPTKGKVIEVRALAGVAT